MGVVRHVDAGYDAAIGFARNNSIRVPMNEVDGTEPVE
jgi:urocanate hydratase